MPAVGVGVGVGMAQSGAAGWTPVALSNIFAWWRADRGITIATGVSQWDDLSGNGRHLTQGTGGAQPAYNSSGGPNNHPYLAFDGIDDVMTDSFTRNQPTYAWAVAIPSGSATSGDTMLDGLGLNTMRIYANTGSTLQVFTGAFGPAVSATLDAWNRVQATIDGASSDLAVNGAVPTTGDAGLNNSVGITIGAQGGAGAFADASYAEIGLLSAVPSANDLANINSYLSLRYGL